MTKKKSRKGKPLKRFDIPDCLPREDICIDIPKEESVCPETGQPLKALREEVSEKLAYNPGSFFVKRYIRAVYASPKIHKWVLSVLRFQRCQSKKLASTLLYSLTF